MMNEVMKKIEGIVVKANERMAEITNGGFPYTLDEVKITVKSDSAGIYVRSGTTPVVAVARAGNPEGVVRDIKKEIWRCVDATRDAVAARVSEKDKADKLIAESEQKEKAVEALKAAGLDVSLLGGVDVDVVKAIRSAADKAVRKANLGLGLMYGSVVDALGGLDAVRMRVKATCDGIIVSADKKPCLVSRYPKVCNAQTLEHTVKFITDDIAALNANRRRYFASLREKMDREERLHELSDRIDSLNAEVVAMAN